MTADSAGRTIATSAEPAWGSASPWVVDEVPSLDLVATGDGPDHEFFRVAELLRMPDGRIIVANAGSHEVRAYSPTGAFLTATGREGDGPGEFRDITQVDLYSGDSVVVLSRPGRATVLDGELRYGRSFELRGVWQRAAGQPNGTVLVTRAPSPFEHLEDVGGVIRLDAPVVRHDRDGMALDTLAVVAGFEQVLVPRGDGVISASLLYGKTLVFAASETVVAFGSAESMVFDVVDLGTLRTTSVRVPDFDLRVAEADRARQEAAYLGPEPSATRRLVLESMPRRDMRPAYTEIVIDASGYYWLAEYVGPADGEERRRWEVFDAGGRWLGGVETPSGFEVHQIGVDYLLGVHTDAFGVEHPQLLALSR